MCGNKTAFFQSERNDHNGNWICKQAYRLYYPQLRASLLLRGLLLPRQDRGRNSRSWSYRMSVHRLPVLQDEAVLMNDERIFHDEESLTPDALAAVKCTLHALTLRCLDAVELCFTNRNAPPWTVGQGVTHHGRCVKAGFVILRNSICIIHTAS